MKLHCFLISWLLALIGVAPIVAQQSPTPHILTLFFKPALQQFCEGSACDVLAQLSIPGYANRTILNNKLIAQLTGGIYVTYAGYVTHSDYNGQVSFPLKHPDNEFYVVVTESIKPVLLFSNTVQQLELVENVPAASYSFTLAQENKKPVWIVKKLPVTGYKIPDNALIIFSQPENIFVAEGTFKADQGPNAVLPHLYVAQTTPLSTNAIQFIKSAKFFAPVMKAFGYAPERYADIIAN